MLAEGATNRRPEEFPLEGGMQLGCYCGFELCAFCIYGSILLPLSAALFFMESLRESVGSIMAAEF